MCCWQEQPPAGHMGSTSWPPAVSALGAAHLAASSASLSYQVGTHHSADVDQVRGVIIPIQAAPLDSCCLLSWY